MLPHMMRELDVRQALHKTEIKRLLELDPTSLVVDELGVLEGKYRIDLAVINDSLHGYEIKSASDNLDRLPSQQESYSKIFDRMTLVADERHVAQALKIIPPWWGLIAVSVREGQTHLNEIWPSRQNRAVDPHALCQLLWRAEALKLLADMGLAGGVRTKSRKLMWRLLVAVLEAKELRAAVSQTIRARTMWRVPEFAKPIAPMERKPRKAKKRRKLRVPAGKSVGSSGKKSGKASRIIAAHIPRP
jgi:hypothetical protein